MAENKLTDKALRNLKPTSKEQVLSDGGGLWVRVLPKDKGGSISFYYRFELGGKERRFNCGTYDETSLSEARANRNAARDLVRKGTDPVDRVHAEKAAKLEAAALLKMEKSVNDLFKDWKRVYLSAHRKDGGKDVEDTMEHDVLPHIGNMRARDVRLAHIVHVIDQVVDRGARRKANLVLSLSRQMFRHGMRRGFVDTDPTLGLTRKDAGGTQAPVERNLSLAELKELAEKLPASKLPERFRAAIWLLLATGTRVGELVKAKWADIDTKVKTWTIPAENSKNGRVHLVHLSPFALRQLNAISKARENSYVLAGRTAKGAIEQQEVGLDEKTLSKAIRDRVRSKPLKNRTTSTGALLLSGGEWSPHDLRRTFATRLGDLGVAPHVIERCLNHVQSGIVGVYQRQEYIPERMAAFALLGKELTKIVKASSSAKAGAEKKDKGKPRTRRERAN